MALSSISYLCSSLDLIDGQIPEAEKEIRVANSYYGFHFYASEYWLDHLLKYYHTTGGLQSASRPQLQTLIDRLIDRHGELRALKNQHCSASNVAAAAQAQDSKTFLQEYLKFREEMKRSKEKTGKGMVGAVAPFFNKNSR